MYCVYGLVHPRGLLYGGGSLLGVSVIGGSTVVE